MGLMNIADPRWARTDFVRAPSEPLDLGHTAAAVALAQDMATMLDTTVEETWWSLYNAPLGMRRLLETPDGWKTLANHIAADLGFDDTDYQPLVH